MSDKQNLHILIVDDHDLIRQGLRLLLQNQNQFVVQADIAMNGEEALRKCNGHKYDIILMDVRMPGMDGIEATTKILKSNQTKIIGLTMHSEEIYAEKMMDAGAKGYVLKNSGTEELVSAITRVLQGGMYFSPEISTRLLEKKYSGTVISKNSRISARSDFDLLSKRESEILKMIADQFTNDEIASRLFLSKRTVDNHRNNIMRKLNAKNTAGLIKAAVDMKLIAPGIKS